MVWTLCGMWCGQYTWVTPYVDRTTDEPCGAPKADRTLHAHHLCLQQQNCGHTTHCVLHTNTTIFFYPCIKMVCMSPLALKTCQRSHEFPQIHSTGLVILFPTKWKDWNVSTGIFCLLFRHQKKALSLKVYLSLLRMEAFSVTSMNLDT